MTKTYHVSDFETELSNGWTVTVDARLAGTPEFWTAAEAALALPGLRLTQAIEVDSSSEWVGSVFTR